MPLNRVVAFTLLLVLAALLRIPAALGDFYNDEIWSLVLTRSLSSPWEAITTLHHDNNHVLNTIMLYLIGLDVDWRWYRAFSVVTGIASVALLGLAAFRRSTTEAVIVLFLASCSFPLILYSSEARGYAPAIFFSLSAFLLLRWRWEREAPWKLILFWLSMILGLLSHLTFAFFFASIALWSFVREIRVGSTSKNLFLELAKSYALPLFFAAVLYLIHIRYIVIGGGAVYSISDVVRRAILIAVGAPANGIAETLLLTAIVGAAIRGFLCLRKEETQIWSFFLAILVIIPGLVLAIQQPERIYFRYLLICFPFLYLLLSTFLAWVFKQGGWGQGLVLLLLVLYAAGNIPRIVDLITLGRGGYQEAMQYMANHTAGSRIVVGSDHDFRNPLVLRYYARFLSSEKNLVYLKFGTWPPEGVDWLLTHSQELTNIPPKQIPGFRGNTYQLQKIFPYSGISGWNWYLYRRATRR